MSRLLKLRGYYISVPNKMKVEEIEWVADRIEERQFKEKPRRIKVTLHPALEKLVLTYMYDTRAEEEILVRPTL